MRSIYSLIIISVLFSCSNSTTETKTKTTETSSLPQEDTIKPIEVEIEKAIVYHDTDFVNTARYSKGKTAFIYDMRYADTNNFLHEKVYDCSACYLRKEVVDALIEANLSLEEKGFQLKFFDCYRPKDVQVKMWEIYPDARYVANPNTTGSIHNRGGAVDITIVDNNGSELDMGTGFDHFGEEAHTTYDNLSDTILSNRILLQQALTNVGFKPIRTEWWHFNFEEAKKYSISNFPISCE